MAEEKPKARKQSMLYEVCSLCNGTGVGPFGNGKCACKRLFVVETGATARQLEAVVEENGKLKARIAELEGQLKRSLDRAIDLAEEKRAEPEVTSFESTPTLVDDPKKKPFGRKPSSPHV